MKRDATKTDQPILRHPCLHWGSLRIAAANRMRSDRRMPTFGDFWADRLHEAAEADAILVRRLTKGGERQTSFAITLKTAAYGHLQSFRAGRPHTLCAEAGLSCQGGVMVGAGTFLSGKNLFPCGNLLPRPRGGGNVVHSRRTHNPWKALPNQDAEVAPDERGCSPTRSDRPMRGSRGFD
jgi:hypothetical protein